MVQTAATDTATSHLCGFKHCFWGRGKHSGWSMSPTGHGPPRMKRRQSKMKQPRSLLELQFKHEKPPISGSRTAPLHNELSFAPPIVDFQNLISNLGKKNSSDIALAAVLWMMSIILLQMTAILLRAALSYLTQPYPADLPLSNANLPVFPLGIGIPPCAPAYHIGRERYPSRKRHEYTVANNLPKTQKEALLELQTSFCLCRLERWVALPAFRIELMREMLIELSEILQRFLHMVSNEN